MLGAPEKTRWGTGSRRMNPRNERRKKERNETQREIDKPKKKRLKLGERVSIGNSESDRDGIQ